MRALTIASMLSAIGCAGSASLDRAQMATDLTRSLLTLLDDTFSPLWTAALAAANRANPDDDVAYHEAIAPQELVFHLIEKARRQHAVLTIAVSRWEQTGDSSAFQHELPCAIRTFDELAQALADADLAQAVRAVDTTLRDVIDAPGTCTEAQ
jgi:hypothetical protein